MRITFEEEVHLRPSNFSSDMVGHITQYLRRAEGWHNRVEPGNLLLSSYELNDKAHMARPEVNATSNIAYQYPAGRYADFDPASYALLGYSRAVPVPTSLALPATNLTTASHQPQKMAATAAASKERSQTPEQKTIDQQNKEMDDLFDF